LSICFSEKDLPSSFLSRRSLSSTLYRDHLSSIHCLKKDHLLSSFSKKEPPSSSLFEKRNPSTTFPLKRALN
jgi:hypothetical protein